MPLGGALTVGLAAAGMLGSGAQAIKGANDAKKAEKGLLSSIAGQQVKTINKEIEQQLAEAQARQGAVSPAVKYGMAMAGQGLSNVAAKAQRGASSGSDYLATLGAGQQQYNSTAADLALQQAQYAQQQQQNVAAARGAMSAERDAALESANAKNAAYQNLYAGQMGAANQMYSQGLSGLAQSATSAASAMSNMYSPTSPGSIGSPTDISSISGKTTLPNLNLPSPISGATKSNYRMNVPGTSSLMSSIPTSGLAPFNMPTPNAGGFNPARTNYPSFPSGFGWY